MRGAYEIDVDAYLDSPEQIQKCLNCEKPRCNLCDGRGQYRSREVIGTASDGSEVRYKNSQAAATALNASKTMIYSAARRESWTKGYRWKFADAE